MRKWELIRGNWVSSGESEDIPTPSKCLLDTFLQMLQGQSYSTIIVRIVHSSFEYNEW